jgi:hypothetical protein
MNLDKVKDSNKENLIMKDKTTENTMKTKNKEKDKDEEATEDNKNDKEATNKQGKLVAVSLEAKKAADTTPSQESRLWGGNSEALNPLFLVKTLCKEKDCMALENAMYIRKCKAYTTVRLPKVTKEDEVKAQK